MGVENARILRAQMTAVVDGLMRKRRVRGATESSETGRSNGSDGVIFE